MTNKPRQFYHIDLAPGFWFVGRDEAKAHAIEAATKHNREVRLSRVVIATDKSELLVLLNTGSPTVISRQILFIAKPKGTPSHENADQ